MGSSLYVAFIFIKKMAPEPAKMHIGDFVIMVTFNYQIYGQLAFLGIY